MKKGNMQLFMGNKGGYFFIVRCACCVRAPRAVRPAPSSSRAACAHPTLAPRAPSPAPAQVKSQSKGMGDSGADALAAMAIGFYYTCGADAQ